MTQTLDKTMSASRSSAPSGAGLRVPRRHTKPGVNPLDEVRWDRRRTVITNPDGSVVFQMDDVEVPAEWSQLATDIVVSKYFRKAGCLAPGTKRASGRWSTGSRTTSARAGEAQGVYFATVEDADAFEAELSYMLVHQIGAFNSPVWFNCGLFHEYGITGSGGNFYFDRDSRAVKATADSYSRPQVSACFIQSIGDDLMSIFELAQQRGARLQVRQRHRAPTSRSCAAAWRSSRAAARSSGLMSVPRGARQGRGRDQVGRHHAPRGQDGGARHGPSRDPRLHPLEGARGEEGRGAGRAAATPRISTATPTAPCPARTRTTRCGSPIASWTRW